VQFSPVFGDKVKNSELMMEYINGTDSDIIIFPELCLTGYFFQSKEESAGYSEIKGSELIQSFAMEAVQQNKTISFGFPENDNGLIYNSIAIMFPDRQYNRIYRKTHLFYKEKFCFEPGNTGFEVIDYKPQDIKIGLMICYDWRFPEAARSLALQGADLIICPSNLVTKVWHKVMPARALENKVYLAVANRYGTEERGGGILEFNGGSAIYSYNGDVAAIAGADTEEVITSEIYPVKTRDKSFNEFNDIFKDRIPEFYSHLTKVD
jgi:predicted amidohydrolase